MSDNTTTTASAPAADTSSAAAPETLENLDASVETEADASAEENAEAQPTQKEIAKKIKQLQLKVDGKEFFEDLPFEIEDRPEVKEYLQKQLQLAKMAQKRAAEAADTKKRLDSIGEYVQSVQGNPQKFRELAKDLGINEKDLVQMIVDEEVQNSKKTPEQVEKEKLEAELKKLKEDRDKEKKEFEEKEFQRLQEIEFQKYETQISEALDANKLPAKPAIVRKVAEYMLLGLQENLDITPKDIVPIVQEEIFNEMSELAESLPEETLEKLFGTTLKRLRKRSVAKAKETPAIPATKAIFETGKINTNEKSTKPSISYKKFFG